MAPSAKKVLVVLGTRPEVIKLAPVIRALEARPGLAVVACVTGQHRELLDGMIATFGLRPRIDLDLMTPRQPLHALAARALVRLGEVLARERPDLTLVQGDTTTAVSAALASFYARVPVGHVEAGLRTGDRLRPYPEEVNRRIISVLADLHFAPTAASARALLAEGIAPESVFVTGNPVIDALLETARRAPPAPPCADRPRTVLVTAHRRESFGDPIRRVCEALRRIAARYPDVGILYPVHPNPEVREPVRELLGGVAGVRLVEPLGYVDFVAALRDAHLVVTDSGGVQEEAPSLGKPVLVVRDTTERPEAVAAGVARLVGTDVATIVAAVAELLDDPAAYARMARGASPFGDGRAADRIAAVVEARLVDRPRPEAGGPGVPP